MYSRYPGHFTGVFTMSPVTLQVYSRCLGSLYRCVHDIPGHFTSVFTTSRVTLKVYLRCLGSLYRCIHDIPGHFTAVFTLHFSNSLRRIFTSFASSFQWANVVSLKHIVFNLSRALVCVSLFVCMCVCVHVCVCVCVVGYACGVMQKGGNMPGFDAEWWEYDCGVMQNGVNMPVVWCRMV